jgi:hypothetical protein
MVTHLSAVIEVGGEICKQEALSVMRRRRAQQTERDQLLRWTGFGARAGGTVFDEMRIRPEKIKRDGKLGGSKDSPEKPGLPKVKSPSGQKIKSPATYFAGGVGERRFSPTSARPEGA